MKQVAIIGAGPAGLMAAEGLAAAGHGVTLFDAMPSPARKFLLAGRGGLNITHSEPLPQFLPRYREAADRVTPLVQAFNPDALRAWCAELGEETFVGSSGRVFPRAFKASPLLRAWLRRLDSQGVTLRSGHLWTGLASDGTLQFRHGTADVSFSADATVLAVGGASWPKLGSTGAWTTLLEASGVDIAPLKPSNCGLRIRWSPFVAEKHGGEPLKRIAITFRDEVAPGEAVITADGLEGGAVYALSGPVRDAMMRDGTAHIHLDLRPDMTLEALAGKLAAGRASDSLSNRLRKQAGLAPAAIAVLRDAAPDLATLPVAALAARIKHAPLTVTGVRPIDRAISSAGGVKWDELDDGLMLKRLPGVFCAGEMIDWEAPTGGYLLQACYATGVGAAAGVNRWLAGRRPQLLR